MDATVAMIPAAVTTGMHSFVVAFVIAIAIAVAAVTAIVLLAPNHRVGAREQ